MLGLFDLSDSALDDLARGACLSNALMVRTRELREAYLAGVPGAHLSPMSNAVAQWLRLPVMPGQGIDTARVAHIVPTKDTNRFTFPALITPEHGIGFIQDVDDPGKMPRAVIIPYRLELGPDLLPRCLDLIAVTEKSTWTYSGRCRWLGQEHIDKARISPTRERLIITRSAWSWWEQHREMPDEPFVQPIRKTALYDLIGLDALLLSDKDNILKIRKFLQTPPAELPQLMVPRKVEVADPDPVQS